MKKILFTWELGEGSGHFAPYLDLVKALEKQGYQIYFALRTLTKAHNVFKDTQVRLLQAPLRNGRYVARMGHVDHYTKILFNSGYCTAEQLAGMILAWKNLLDLVEPDLMVCDFSPTALLASRERNIPRISLGSGFFTPPETRPIIGLDQLQGAPQNPEEVLLFENKLLGIVNQALTYCGMSPLENIFEIYRAEKYFFRTFKEMDHYPNRKDGEYYGVFRSSGGEKPLWPKHGGPRIFAYLKGFKALPHLLAYLREKQYPTLIYGDGLSETLKAKFACDSLTFVDKPLDMSEVGKTAALAITNAGHGTTCEMLLEGVPMLCIPLQAEQNIIARNVTRLGAGLNCADHDPETMSSRLEKLISEPGYREAAKEFSSRYQDFDDKKIIPVMCDWVDQLLRDDKSREN